MELITVPEDSYKFMVDMRDRLWASKVFYESQCVELLAENARLKNQAEELRYQLLHK